jgi:ABC-2 type transport system permease protein
LYWQPFRGLADVPFRIYSGHIDPQSAVFEILLQFTWAGVIVLGGYALMACGKSRVVVQGG